MSRNSKDDLLQCLKAFFASADVPVDAVVVDNDSSDGSPAAVTDEFPHATVLVQSKNLGYGRAANVGLERCQGRFVLLLSPHVILDPQCSGRLADLLDHDPPTANRREIELTTPFVVGQFQPSPPMPAWPASAAAARPRAQGRGLMGETGCFPHADSTGSWALHGKTIQRSVRLHTYSHWTLERGFS